MKCFIIAALSADGFIAKDERHAAYWTSKEDKKRFVELTKRAGVIVMGLNTWKTLPRPLKERLNIVYSRSVTFIEGAEVTTKKPADLLKDLEERGYKEVAICGGSQIYNLFMKERLVTSIYLTIEPILFGKGLRLFNDDFLFHLKLKSVGQTDNGSILIEYAVDYSGTPKAESNPS